MRLKIENVFVFAYNRRLFISCILIFLSIGSSAKTHKCHNFVTFHENYLPP